jgi:hypothetical protein
MMPKRLIIGVALLALRAWNACRRMTRRQAVPRPVVRRFSDLSQPCDCEEDPDRLKSGAADMP